MRNTTFLISLLFGFAIFLFFLTNYMNIENWAIKRYHGRINWVKDKLEKMFLRIPEYQVLLINFLPFILFGLLFIFLTIGLLWYLALPIIFAFMTLGWFLPILVIKIWYYLRLRKFDLQLTDALNMLASALKSGLSFLQAIQLMVEQMQNPISQEFRLLLAEHKLGSTLEDSLTSMSNRIPSEDLMIAVNSIVILRETGGDLTETFETLVRTIIQRRKVEGKIKSMTSMGVMQGFMLASLPFAMGIIFYMASPESMTKMFTTPIGLGMVVAGLTLITVGGYIIKKVVTIDV